MHDDQRNCSKSRPLCNPTSRKMFLNWNLSPVPIPFQSLSLCRWLFSACWIFSSNYRFIWWFNSPMYNLHSLAQVLPPRCILSKTVIRCFPFPRPLNSVFVEMKLSFQNKKCWKRLAQSCFQLAAVIYLLNHLISLRSHFIFFTIFAVFTLIHSSAFELWRLATATPLRSETCEIC